MSERLVMGFWDCPYCHTKKIKGTLQDCPNCSATRGKDTKFYMDSSNPHQYLTEEESSNKGKGADWMCDYCRSYNSAVSTTCKNCGAHRQSSNKDYFEIRRDQI